MQDISFLRKQIFGYIIPIKNTFLIARKRDPICMSCQKRYHWQRWTDRKKQLAPPCEKIDKETWKRKHPRRNTRMLMSYRMVSMDGNIITGKIFWILLINCKHPNPCARKCRFAHWKRQRNSPLPHLQIRWRLCTSGRFVKMPTPLNRIFWKLPKTMKGVGYTDQPPQRLCVPETSAEIFPVGPPGLEILKHLLPQHSTPSVSTAVWTALCSTIITSGTFFWIQKQADWIQSACILIAA